jgi:hypothetical protein
VGSKGRVRRVRGSRDWTGGVGVAREGAGEREGDGRARKRGGGEEMEGWRVWEWEEELESKRSMVGVNMKKCCSNRWE